MTTPVTKYRKDYLPPSHFITAIELTIELEESFARVTSKQRVTTNSAHSSTTLCLNGRAQTLISVTVNEQRLSLEDYTLDEESLTLNNLPDEFILEIVSECKPQENTSLMGLYKSGGNFCTQCEAEGFRKITYFLDRPDVLSVFTTTIIADKCYPVLLSNGNLIEQGELDDGRHYAKWHDPFKKPCYLFAMVAGDLACLEDSFTTCNDRTVTLKIFADEKVIDRCQYAMQALKKSMKWDEETYGREYDLDIFMIVAVNDFNFGAMENKGLNIFNDKYILVDPKTATDTDYALIDAVVGHEYFHNWSGNRVTVRDWFQLSLKEGFTVFRDHSFSESIGLLPFERINQVKRLRNFQFSEDAGPLAHPIRPDSYIEMNNFYTMTVYEKGSEVIRMMRTILGARQFRQGSDLYFERNDGKAVTCDDFVQAMQDASGIDLTQFKRWYSQAGTPELTITTNYDSASKQYHVVIKQQTPATPGQAEKAAFHIPIAIGLLDSAGQDMSLQLTSKEELVSTYVLNLTEAEQRFTFINVNEEPVPSLLRGFSAPVKLNYNYSERQLAFLMAYDSDAVARWEAGQQLAVQVLFKLIQQCQQSEDLQVPDDYLVAVKAILQHCDANKAIAAMMLVLPEESYLVDLLGKVDVDAVVTAKRYLEATIANNCYEQLLAVYQANQVAQPFNYDNQQAAQRALRNACLHYLSLAELDDRGEALALEQFRSADNMTDQLSALVALSNRQTVVREEVLAGFFEQWREDNLVLDKWFGVQALSRVANVLDEVKGLLTHPQFNIKNPNKVRALLGAFTRNFAAFHAKDGLGYRLIADQALIVDKLNPGVSSRLIATLANWRQFDEGRQALMCAELERVLAEPGLSKDVYEIASKSLGIAQLA